MVPNKRTITFYLHRDDNQMYTNSSLDLNQYCGLEVTLTKIKKLLAPQPSFDGAKDFD